MEFNAGNTLTAISGGKKPHPGFNLARGADLSKYDPVDNGGEFFIRILAKLRTGIGKSAKNCRYRCKFYFNSSSSARRTEGIFSARRRTDVSFLILTSYCLRFFKNVSSESKDKSGLTHLKPNDFNRFYVA